MAKLDEIEAIGGLSQKQVSERSRLSRNVERFRQQIEDSDRACAEERTEAQEYNKRWNQLAKTAIETFPVDPKSNEVIAGGFVGLYREFGNSWNLGSLVRNKTTLDPAREKVRKYSSGAGRPGLKEETLEAVDNRDHARMLEKLLPNMKEKISDNINTIAGNVVKQGQLPRTATGWLAEQAVKSDDLGKFVEFLVADPEAVIVHFAATNGLRELSGWLAGAVGGTAAGVATTNVGVGVVTAAVVNKAVDKAIGMLVAVAFAENEALIDMLQADSVSLKDKQAVAAYIEENLDGIVKEVSSARADAFQDELLEALIGLKGSVRSSDK
ncbi:MAG: hypothetical protein OEZ03_13310, partial [Alphaproteobacteria bacterium]|nr:hypothetical protein [Alphaproteobacteria bacterium]